MPRARFTTSLALAASSLALSVCGPAPVPLTARRPLPPAPEAPAVAASAALALFQTLDALGYPDTRGRPLVRVWTGRWLRMGNDPLVLDTRVGFLLAEDARTFRVQLLLDAETFERGAIPHPQPGVLPVHYETLDFEAHLRALLAAAEASSRESSFDPLQQAQLRASPQLQAFLWAHAAWQRGHRELSHRMLALAARPGINESPQSPRSLTERVRHELALTLLWNTVLEAGETRLSRAELRERFARIAEHLRGEEHAATAGELARALDRMLAEDASHAPPPSPSPEAELAELVYSLRELHSVQWGQPGWPDVLEDPQGPAARLLARGRAAVPTLLALTEDDRLTRTVGYGRDFFFSHRVLRYRDVALAVLSRLAGRTLLDRAAAEAWWTQAQSMTEAEQLALGLRTLRGYEAGLQARLLLAAERPRALRELTALLATELDDDTRAAVYSALAADRGPDTLSLLRAALAQGSTAARLAAAEGLSQRGDSTWFAALRATLEALLRAGTPEEALSRGVTLLVSRGGEQGLRLLRERYSALPRRARYQALWGLFDFGASRTRPAPEAAAADALLELALDDEEPEVGAALTIQGASCNAPRLQYLAALCLAARARVPFDCTWPYYRRERALTEYRNFLRAARSERALPLPEPPLAPTAPRATAEAAREALSAARSTEQSAAALGRFSALGLAGLAPLTATLASLEASHPAREASGPVLARLASSVREVRLEGSTLPLSLRAELEALRDQPLTAAMLLQLLQRAVRGRPSGSLALWLHRDGSGRGVTLRLRSSPEAPASATSCDYAASVRDGVRYTAGMSGGGTLSADAPADPWSYAASALRPVLEGAPTVDGELLFTFRWRR